MEQSVHSPTSLIFSVRLPSVIATGRWKERGRMGGGDRVRQLGREPKSRWSQNPAAHWARGADAFELVPTGGRQLNSGVKRELSACRPAPPRTVAMALWVGP